MPSPLRSSEQNAIRAAMASSGLRSRVGRPSTATVPESAWSAPNSSRASSVRPEPSSPASPTHLAGVHGEVDRRDGPRATQPGGGEHRGVGQLGDVGGRLAVEVGERGQLLADHLLHHLQPRELGERVLADQLAVAQDRDAVGDRVDLVEEVRHEEHGHPGVADVADHPEQLADLVGVEAGGGLVEDEHGGVEVDRPGDGHQLLDGERVAAEHRIRVDGQVERARAARRPGAGRRAGRCGRACAARGRAGCSPRR